MKRKVKLNTVLQLVGVSLSLSPFVAMLVYCVVIIYQKVDGIYDWVVTAFIVMLVGMLILVFTDDEC